jgi:predicted O-linked N-acetylglucosamine transferase (SPINDLY family)
LGNFTQAEKPVPNNNRIRYNTPAIPVQSVSNPMSSEQQLTLEQAFQLAQQRLSAGDLAQAQSVCAQILKVAPRQPRVLQLMARIALAANQLEVAIQHFQMAVEGVPLDPGLLAEMGNAMLSAGHPEEAARAYERSLGLAPLDAGIVSNLGVALFECGQHDAAIEQLRRALTMDSGMPQFHNNLGHALKELGRLSEAIAVLRAILSKVPNHVESAQNLAHALLDCGQIEEAIAVCRDMLVRFPRTVSLHSAMLTFLLHDPKTTPRTLLEEHRSWNQLHAAPLAGRIPAPANDRSPERRLRVGYLAADLRERSVAYFLEYLLACHDLKEFEVFCYADSQRRSDAGTRRLRQSASQWRSITGMGELRLIELIRKDQIDILVDLTGHFPGSRLLAMACRAAPVQISYLGYPATSGVDALRLRFTDEVADPAGVADAFYSEKLIRLTRSFLSYRPPEDAPAPALPPAKSSGFVTFGSFEPLARINLSVIALWSRAMQQLPTSRLLLRNLSLGDAGTKELLRSRFAENGISADRLDLGAAPQSTREQLELHRQVDILLDPYPYSGMLGTCEALWMGVPVVTLAGASQLGRASASILTHVGLPELVAASADEFVKIAANLAQDPARLASLRSALRERVRQSPLMGGFRFARDIEREYRAAWKRWCSAI